MFLKLTPVRQMMPDPLLVNRRALTYIFDFGNYFLSQSRCSLRFPVTNTFFYVFVYFFRQNICFSQWNDMYGFFVSGIKNYIQAFSGNIRNLSKESCFSRVFGFFKQLVYIHSVCSLNLSSNRLLICVKNPDHYRLLRDRPSSDAYSSLFCFLLFEINLWPVSFFLQLTRCNRKPGCFFIRKFLIDHQFMKTV